MANRNIGNWKLKVGMAEYGTCLEDVSRYSYDAEGLRRERELESIRQYAVPESVLRSTTSITL